ncbi:UNKNOWN [Stylonychia lemnae]|uniref:Uncharacterized protein n=1 Tax=Stylonychia lemnae TaxID=5949 RepID=A0A078AI11_STYLE|nr:UNKNOWN [Stylonychia lemnae]|eukprot:CDW81152.1 UNKNOWN [Stylonychia lemnae]
MLNDDEIERILKKDLVKQLQDLKRKDIDRAAFFYEIKSHKAKNQSKNRKTLANKRRFFELIAQKKQMMQFEDGQLKSYNHKFENDDPNDPDNNDDYLNDDIDPEALKMRADYNGGGGKQSGSQNPGGGISTSGLRGTGFMTQRIVSKQNMKKDELYELEMSMKKLVPDSKLINKVLYKREEKQRATQNNGSELPDLESLNLGLSTKALQSHRDKHREVEKFIQKIDQRRSQKTNSIAKPLFIKKREAQEERKQKKEQIQRIETLKQLIEEKLKLEKQVQQKEDQISKIPQIQGQNFKPHAQDEKSSIEKQLEEINSQIIELASPKPKLQPKAKFQQYLSVPQTRQVDGNNMAMSVQARDSNTGFMSQRLKDAPTQIDEQIDKLNINEEIETPSESNKSKTTVNNKKLLSSSSMPQLELKNLKTQSLPSVSNYYEMSHRSNFQRQLQPINIEELEQNRKNREITQKMLQQLSQRRDSKNNSIRPEQIVEQTFSQLLQQQKNRIDGSPRLRQIFVKMESIYSVNNSPKSSMKRADSIPNKNKYLLSPYQSLDLWNFFENEEKKRKNQIHDLMNNGQDLDDYMEAQKYNMMGDSEQVKHFKESKEIYKELQELEKKQKEEIFGIRQLNNSEKVKIQRDFMRRNADQEIVFNRNDQSISPNKHRKNESKNSNYHGIVSNGRGKYSNLSHRNEIDRSHKQWAAHLVQQCKNYHYDDL